MIRNTDAVNSPGKKNIISKKPSDSKFVKEGNTPEDKFEINAPYDSERAQERRKASIEFYHLHKKKPVSREEERGRISNGDTPRGKKKIDEDGKTVSTPTVLEMKETDKISSLLGISSEGIDVGPFEKKLQAELGSHATIQNDWDIDRLKGKIPTLSQLNEIFSKPANDPSIPWEYLPDGCYARAHMTSKELLDKGYNCAKMYVIIGDISSNPFSPFPKWRLKAKNKFTKGEWWYHVAPLTFAKDEKTGKTEGYILDAAVNKDRPLKASEWTKAFWSGDFPINFDVTHADVYDPPEQSFFDYSPKEFSQKRFDKYIPLSKKTNRDYSKVLKKIKDQYYADHPDEKPEA